jgi:hypothetical protein
MFHQGAGIWRDSLRPGSGAADEADTSGIREESKPEPGAKWPPKTAQRELSNSTRNGEGANARSAKHVIEAMRVLVKYPG